MVASSVRSLHQPADYVTGDDTGFKYGIRDSSRSAVGSSERDEACVHLDTVKLKGKIVRDMPMSSRKMEVKSDTFEEHSILAAGSRPTPIDIIERTDSQLFCDDKYRVKINIK